MTEQMMTKIEDYIPFEAEWKEEMMKWTKPMLIDFLREKLIELASDEVRAGVAVIEAMKEGKVYICRDMMAIEMHGGKLMIDLDDKGGLREIDSPLSAITELLKG